MENKKQSGAIKILVLLTYVLTIVVNGIAATTPINGNTTAAVSYAFPTLFTPAGLTFSIWGIIYILLGAYTLYQLGLFQGKNRNKNSALLNKVGIFFIITSIANSIWIFLWSYEMFALTLVLMLVLLVCLMKITNDIKKESLSAKEKLFIKLPFSVYFGWITVATIANISVWLVSIRWDGFGLPPVLWAAIILIIGALIGGLKTIKDRDFAYGLVIIWAYIGILLQQTSDYGYNGQYPTLVTIVIVCIAALCIAEVYLLASAKKHARKAAEKKTI